MAFRYGSCCKCDRLQRGIEDVIKFAKRKLWEEVQFRDGNQFFLHGFHRMTVGLSSLKLRSSPLLVSICSISFWLKTNKI